MAQKNARDLVSLCPWDACCHRSLNGPVLIRPNHDHLEPGGVRARLYPTPTEPNPSKNGCYGKGMIICARRNRYLQKIIVESVITPTATCLSIQSRSRRWSQI